MAKVTLGPVAMGLEYYSSLPDEHYLFEAVDLIAVKNLEVNFAVGEGRALIAKMIVGYAF
jgi:hypothetical protein